MRMMQCLLIEKDGLSHDKCSDDADRLMKVEEFGTFFKMKESKDVSDLFCTSKPYK